MHTTHDASIKKTACPAHLGWRLLALLYDSIPTIALLMLVSVLFLVLRSGDTVEAQPLFAALEFFAFWLMIGLYAVLSWRYGGQTLGMRAWRLRVVANDGQPAALKNVCVRYLVASLTPGICLLWSLVDSEHRGLHDWASGTRFVRVEG